MNTITLEKQVRTMPARRLRNLAEQIEERDGVKRLLGSPVDRRLLELTRYFIRLRSRELDKLVDNRREKLPGHTAGIITRNWGKPGRNSRVRIVMERRTEL